MNFRVGELKERVSGKKITFWQKIINYKELEDQIKSCARTLNKV